MQNKAKILLKKDGQWGYTAACTLPNRRMMKSSSDFDRLGEAESTLPESIRYRLDIVFAAAALTVLAGLLIPVPIKLLDMAWIGCICLAAAVVVISLIAKSCHDLQGFGFLAGALVLLRICLTAMTVRKILVEHTSSAVIDILGKSVQGMGAIGAAIIALLLAIVGFGSLFPAAGWIRRAVANYATQILPVKRASLQAELSLKGIPHQQGRQILEKIRTEMRFYGSMGAVAVLMRCEAVAGLVMIVVALTIKIATDAIAAGYNRELMDTLAADAAGLVIIAVIPSAAAGWACAFLTRKDSLCLKVVDSPAEEKSQKIKLAGRPGDSGQEVELLNPDFVTKARAIEQAEEKIAEFETEKKPDPNLKEYPVTPLRCDSLEQYYQKLTGHLQAVKSEKGQAVLLTCPVDTSLGINIAVNAAIGLVGAGLKVLLIDIEPRRCAAAKAFDLDAPKTLTGPHKTCIDNLHIFTAGNTESQAIGRAVLAMDKLQEQYDRILIYGPQRLGILAGKTASRFHAVIFAKSTKGSDVIALTPETDNYASVVVLPGPDAAITKS
jgi:hypothetical protein